MLWLLCVFVAGVFGGKANLSPDFTVEWDLDQASSIMTFNITVKKADWVGIGFHPVGSSTDEAMVSADCIIATFDSKGKVLVDDYYSMTFEQPSTDVLMGGTDDVLSFSGEQANGVSRFEFKRKLVTADTDFDVAFSTGPCRVIWAIGTSNDFGYHGTGSGNRGSSILDLFDSDVCGPIKECKACVANTKCVFCTEDNLCYDKSNTGFCTPLNSTCNNPAPFACDNPIPQSSLPQDFCATEWIGGLDFPRQLVHADNGDVLVLEGGKNQVTVIWEDGGVVNSNTLAVAPGINHGVAISNQYLYATSSSSVYRWRYIPGQREPLGNYEVVIHSIPTGGHFSRTPTFDAQGMLYVVIGSAGNVDQNTARSVIRQFNVNNVPTGGYAWNTGVIYVDGLRNTVGLAWDSEGRLWGVDNGIDNLNRANIGGDIHQNNPCEEVNLLTARRFYGYPYCWSEYDLPVYGLGEGTQWAHPNFMNDGTHTDAWCRNTNNVVPPAWNMPAHTAPLDIKFYYGDSFPSKYKGGAFVALHGSWNRQPPAGYRVLYLPFTNGLPTAEEIFFAYAGSGERWPSDIRPTSISFGPCGTQDCLYLTSDSSGQIIRISYSPDK